MNVRDYEKVFKKLGISHHKLPAYDNPQNFARKLKKSCSTADQKDLALQFKGRYFMEDNNA